MKKVLYTTMTSVICVDENGKVAWQLTTEQVAALREAGEKMAEIYTHLPKELRNESNVYYQILLSGIEATELRAAFEAWEAANK